MQSFPRNDAAIQSIGLKLKSFISVLLIVSAFLPYAALPVGTNTNIPISGPIAFLLTLAVYGKRPWIGGVFAAAAIPTVLAYMLTLAGAPTVNVAALVTWIFIPFSITGFAAAALILGSKVVRVLSIAIFASAVFAIVQKFVFLDHGSIPLIGLYDVPGYASVVDQQSLIVDYIRRPFGLFPEPSFMAGSLGLAVAALIILSRRHLGRVTFFDAISSLLGVVAIVLSNSGSGILSLLLLAILAVIPWFRSRPVLVGLSPLLLASALALSFDILKSRNASGNNYSWGERAASLIGAARLVTSNASNALLGVGSGQSAGYFQRGEVPLGGLNYSHQLDDVYSAIGKIIVEIGLPLGGLFGAAIAFALVRFGGEQLRPGLQATLVCVIWIVIAVFTISYTSAAWLWALPGLLIARGSGQESGVPRPKIARIL